MAIPGDIGVAFRVRAPQVLERGAVQTTSLESRSGTGLVAPSSGTYRLVSPSGATVASGAVTVTADVATYAISAEDLPATLAYGPGYVEEWALVFAGVTHRPRREAYLARRALHCPVTHQDILDGMPGLDRSLGSAVSSFDTYRDQVWGDTLIKLRASGTWPEQIVEVSSLGPYVRAETLYRFFVQLAFNAPQGQYDATIATFKEQAADAWRSVRFSVDSDEDGIPDDPETLRAVSPTVVVRGAAPQRRSRLGRVLG